jgi:hypothetical protein
MAQSNSCFTSNYDAFLGITVSQVVEEEGLVEAVRWEEVEGVLPWEEAAAGVSAAEVEEDSRITPPDGRREEEMTPGEPKRWYTSLSHKYTTLTMTNQDHSYSKTYCAS